MKLYILLLFFSLHLILTGDGEKCPLHGFVAKLLILSMVFLPVRPPTCAWCSYPCGLQLVHGVPTRAASNLSMVFLPVRPPTCPWCSYPCGLQLVHGVPTRAASNLSMVFLPVRPPTCAWNTPLLARILLTLKGPRPNPSTVLFIVTAKLNSLGAQEQS